MSDVGLNDAASVAVFRSLQRVPQLIVRHATVVELQTGGLNLHDVLVDGDEPDNRIQAHDIAQADVYEGARVTLLFAPPHQALIIGLPIIDDWHFVGESLQPAFNTGWVNGTGTGAPDTDNFARVSFRRIGPWVELRGLANRTSGSQTRIFTLPEGYRPRNNLRMTAWHGLAQAAGIEVQRDGDVVISGAISPPLHLDTIIFSTI